MQNHEIAEALQKDGTVTIVRPDGITIQFGMRLAKMPWREVTNSGRQITASAFGMQEPFGAGITVKGSMKSKYSFRSLVNKVTKLNAQVAVKMANADKVVPFYQHIVTIYGDHNNPALRGAFMKVRKNRTGPWHTFDYHRMTPEDVAFWAARL